MRGTVPSPPADVLKERYPSASERRRLESRLRDPDDRKDFVFAFGVFGEHCIVFFRHSHLTVKGERIPGAFRINPRNPLNLADSFKLALAGIEAFEGREQLIHSRKGPECGREIDAERADAFGVAVCKIAERIEGAAIGCAKAYQRAGVLPSFQNLQEVSGDQPSHRMSNEDQLRVTVAGLAPPAFEPFMTETLKAASGNAVVTAPVVGEFEKVLSRLKAKRRP